MREMKEVNFDTELIHEKEKKDAVGAAEPEEDELTLTNKIIVAIGYIFSIILPVVGLVYGIILLMLKNEPQIYRKHAPYIIIISIILCFIIALIEMLYYHII